MQASALSRLPLHTRKKTAFTAVFWCGAGDGITPPCYIACFIFWYSINRYRSLLLFSSSGLRRCLKLAPPACYRKRVRYPVYHSTQNKKRQSFRLSFCVERETGSLPHAYFACFIFWYSINRYRSLLLFFHRQVCGVALNLRPLLATASECAIPSTTPHTKKDSLYSCPFVWSGRRDSDPRLSPWQGDTLPLSHSRISIALLLY